MSEKGETSRGVETMTKEGPQGQMAEDVKELKASLGSRTGMATYSQLQAATGFYDPLLEHGKSSEILSWFFSSYSYRNR